MSRNAREQKLEGRIIVQIPHTSGDSFFAKWRPILAEAGVEIEKPERGHRGAHRKLTFQAPATSAPIKMLEGGGTVFNTSFFIQKLVERYGAEVLVENEANPVLITFNFDDFSSGVRVEALKADTYDALVEKAYTELQRQLDREERIEALRNAEYTLAGYTVAQDDQIRTIDLGDGVSMTMLRNQRDRIAFHRADKNYNDFWGPKVEVVIDRDHRKYDSEEDWYTLTPKTVSGLKMSWSGTSGVEVESIARVYAQMLIKAANVMSTLRKEFNLPELEVANA